MLAERVQAHVVSIVRRMGHVQVEPPDGIAFVTFSNPGRKNAIPTSAWPDVERVVREIGTRRDDRCVVVTGAGDDCCAGADISAMAGSDGAHPL